MQNNGVYGLAPYDCVEVSEDRLHVLLEDAACVSCARPLYSGFHVQGSITSWPWDASVPLRSGNVEYGYYQATHNEEAAVVAHLATHNPGNPHPPILALVNGDHEGSLETLTMPCGNCRDILRDVIGPTCALIIGTLGGGTAIFARLEDILFDRYAPQPIPLFGSGVERVIRAIVRQGMRLRKNPYGREGKFSLREYTVCILTGSSGAYSSGRYIGAHRVGADFHPYYAGEIAVMQAEYARDPFLEKIIIAVQGDGSAPPDVLYRDRQCLAEFSLECELVTDKESGNTPVELYTHTEQGISGAWTTTLAEWLPLPFTPRSFGQEFLEGYTTYLKNLYID
ncbi:MAG: hypothetical protein AAB416_01800 [Patescibacteria group bacterium]